MENNITVTNNLEYATWESLDPSMNFQAYDRDGWLVAYEKRPLKALSSEQWLPDGEYEGGQWIKQFDGPIIYWQQSLIERPMLSEPEPEHENKEEIADQLWAAQATEYDPS